MEHVPLLPHTSGVDAEYQHHPQRWWLLFICSAMSFTQGWIWNDWG